MIEKAKRYRCVFSVGYILFTLYVQQYMRFEFLLITRTYYMARMRDLF